MEDQTTVQTTTSASGEQNVGDATNYIEAIKEIKANSVSKEKYDKLMADNKALLDAMINGAELPAQPQVEKKPVDVNALRKKLFSPESDLSNLEYAKAAVELRDALLEQEGYDCFAPSGTNYKMTPEDITGPEKLATALKAAIEYADGDSALFTQELMRVTKNDSPLRAALARR